MAPILSPVRSCHVAVIGAGAAGLVAARELRREGQTVVVFERGNQIGGTWIYTSETEPDPLSLDPTRSIVHSSLYASLRTNLARECMGFLNYPFIGKPTDSRDPRRFPAHWEVLAYLQDFAREFGICDTVRFETEVVNVCLERGKWIVKSKSKNNRLTDEVFDAVVVCNGHYTEPRIADVPGIKQWPGKQMHSHNYRVPEPFRDQVVVLIGNSASAVDISRDLTSAAKEVHVASRSVAPETYEKQPGYDNLFFHSMIESCLEDGYVVFQNGKAVLANVIMHCTGYNYHYPFLESNGTITVDDNCVGPLYKHVFPPSLAPWLSFIGIPSRIIPFPMYELQSKWIAGVLSGRISLPSQEEMMEDVKTLYADLEASGVPKRYTHQMAQSQFEFDGWCAAQCGCSGIEPWRKQMFLACVLRMRNNPETYRDEWEDEHLVAQAYEDFKLSVPSK